MPSLRLYVSGVPLVQNRGTPHERSFPDGSLPLDPPLHQPALSRVLNRRLMCVLRFPPAPGAVDAILDTGAPLGIFPRHLWRDRFDWRAGRDFDVCDIAGLGPTVTGQVLGHVYTCRIVRLRHAVEVCGADLGGQRLTVERLLVQLPDSDGPKHTILGVWGGAFEGRQLAVDRRPESDDLTARLDW